MTDELTTDQIKEIQRRGTGPDAEKVGKLAAEFGVSTAKIRFCLNRPAAAIEDMGFGEAEEGAREENPLAALLADEKTASLLNGLIEKAVADRVAQLGLSAVPASSDGNQNASFEAFTQTIKHLIEMNAQQMPGYQKPLSAEEMDKRANGLIEMKALLRQYETANTPPHYEVGMGKFYVDCVLHEPGEKIGMYIPPAEDMRPLNAEAEAVHAAMMEYSGGPSPWIGDRVADAMRTEPPIPIVGRGEGALPKGRVTVIQPSPQTEMTRRMQSLGPNASSEMAKRLAQHGLQDATPMGPFGG